MRRRFFGGAGTEERTPFRPPKAKSPPVGGLLGDNEGLLRNEAFGGLRLMGDRAYSKGK